MLMHLLISCVHAYTYRKIFDISVDWFWLGNFCRTVSMLISPVPHFIFGKWRDVIFQFNRFSFNWILLIKYKRPKRESETEEQEKQISLSDNLELLQNIVIIFQRSRNIDSAIECVRLFGFEKWRARLTSRDVPIQSATDRIVTKPPETRFKATGLLVQFNPLSSVLSGSKEKERKENLSRVESVLFLSWFFDSRIVCYWDYSLWLLFLFERYF